MNGPADRGRGGQVRRLAKALHAAAGRRGPASLVIITALAAFAPAGVRGQAASVTGVRPLPAAGLSVQDRSFLRDAAQTGQAMLLASEFTLQHATLRAVRELARRVADDHARAYAALERLARRKGVMLPARPTSAQLGRVQMLEVAAGAALDRQYLRDFGVMTTQGAIVRFNHELSLGEDAEAQAYARSTLAMLRRHLADARAVERRAGSG